MLSSLAKAEARAEARARVLEDVVTVEGAVTAALAFNFACGAWAPTATLGRNALREARRANTVMRHLLVTTTTRCALRVLAVLHAIRSAMACWRR